MTVEKKIDRCVVGMRRDYAYIIVRQYPNTGEATFFGGFFNEVENIGEVDECQYWENEEWVGNEESAWKFTDYSEAKAIFDNLVDNSDCFLTMYGKGLWKNFGGTEWYPLKKMTR